MTLSDNGCQPRRSTAGISERLDDTRRVAPRVYHEGTPPWAELAAVLLVELKHADLCERQRFGGLPRLVERAVHRNVVLLILSSLSER
jgi:hypothetical protein